MVQLGPRWHWTSPRALLAGRDPCNRYLAPGCSRSCWEGMPRASYGADLPFLAPMYPYPLQPILPNQSKAFNSIFKPRHPFQPLYSFFCLDTGVISVCLNFVHGDQLRQRTVWCQHQIQPFAISAKSILPTLRYTRLGSSQSSRLQLILIDRPTSRIT